jgi:hypothetical protein
MRIGYGRLSTRDQNHEAQHDALHAAGCERIFIDHASGKLATRPELDKALLCANRAGDQLVVTKLDRLGRSLEHLELSKLLHTRGVDLGSACSGARRWLGSTALPSAKEARQAVTSAVIMGHFLLWAGHLKVPSGEPHPARPGSCGPKTRCLYQSDRASRQPAGPPLTQPPHPTTTNANARNQPSLLTNRSPYQSMSP